MNGSLTLRKLQKNFLAAGAFLRYTSPRMRYRVDDMFLNNVETEVIVGFHGRLVIRFYVEDNPVRALARQVFQTHAQEGIAHAAAAER